MTISNTTSAVVAQGNSATTAFAYNFLIPDAADAVVTYTDQFGVPFPLNPTQYTITGIGNPLGGTVNYPLVGLPIITGSSLTIERRLTAVQGTSVSGQGPVFAAIEQALDYLTMLDQQADATQGRAIVFPAVDANPVGLLPPAAQRANKTLGFDSAGNAIVGGVANVMVSAIMYPVVQASTLAAARAALGGLSVRPVTAAGPVTTADNSTLILATTAGGSFALTLLSAAAAGVGFSFEVKKDASANPLTITPAEAFWTGETSLILGPLDRVRFTSTGAAWEFDGYPENIGVSKVFTYLTADTRFLLEAGQAVSRATYARLHALYAAAGYPYGNGDGSTTFNLRDKRGRTDVALDNQGGTAANRSQVSTTITTTSGSPTATVASAAGLFTGMGIVSANVPANATILTIVGTTITMSANATASVGGTAARFSPFGDAQVLGTAAGELGHPLTVAELPPHPHTITSQPVSMGTIGSTPLAVYTSGGSSPSGLVAGSSFSGLVLNGQLTVSGTTDNAGGGLRHNNVQPSINSYSYVRI